MEELNAFLNILTEVNTIYYGSSTDKIQERLLGEGVMFS